MGACRFGGRERVLSTVFGTLHDLRAVWDTQEELEAAKPPERRAPEVSWLVPMCMLGDEGRGRTSGGGAGGPACPSAGRQRWVLGLGSVAQGCVPGMLQSMSMGWMQFESKVGWLALDAGGWQAA